MRITVEEGLETVMGVVLNPDTDMVQVRAVVGRALQATENHGFGAGVRWQCHAFLILGREGRERVLAKYAEENNVKERPSWSGTVTNRDWDFSTTVRKLNALLYNVSKG